MAKAETTFDASPSSVAGAVATWSSVSIGAAAADRIVVLNAQSSRNAGATNVLSATIDTGGGAVSMTAVAAQTSQGVECVRQFYAHVPSGTTATFVVTYSVALVDHQVYASGMRVTGSMLTPLSSGGDGSTDMDSTDPLSVAPTIPPGGVFIGIAGSATNTNSHSWTNATAVVDVGFGSSANGRHSVGVTTTPGTPTITVQGTVNGEDGALTYVVFRDAQKAFNAPPMVWG